MISQDAILSFILRYRKDTLAFRKDRGYDIEKLRDLISYTIMNHLMIVDAEDSKIFGILTFKLDKEARTIHISHALTVKSISLKRLIARAIEIYGKANFDTITFERRNKMKSYNLNSFLRRIYG